MELYKGMRLISFTSFTFGTAACFVSGWIFISNRNIELEDTTNNGSYIDSCKFNNVTNFDELNYYRKSVLRSCIVVVIVSILQIVSGIFIFASPLQGSRNRAKYWFGINLGLNLILFLSFFVPLMSTQRRNINIFGGSTIRTEVDSTKDSVHCSWWWSMTSGAPLHHLNTFYISVCLDFVVHFLVLVFSLMMLRYDENRDYELVAIV